MDRAGRVAIPKRIRERAGLRPGLDLVIKYRNGKVEVEIPFKVRLVRRGSFLVGIVPANT